MKTKYQDGNADLFICVGEESLNIDTDVSLLYVYDFDWNEMLSPWPSERIFKTQQDFAGRAEETMTFIHQQIAKLPRTYEHIILCGYSLAGLFSLYACTKMDCWDGVVCCSGSLWYPGIVDYMLHTPLQAKYVYMSLGDKEKKAAQPLLCTVEDCTNQIYSHIASLCKSQFVWNKGTHFDHPADRLIAGMKAMEGMLR